MHKVTETALQWWTMGRKIKHNSTGWYSGNACCCVHRGESLDSKGRGGLIVSESGYSYSCFNCGFKTTWKDGSIIEGKNKHFLYWLGISKDEVNRLSLEALKTKHEIDGVTFSVNLELEEKQLPNSTKYFYQLDNEKCDDPFYLKAKEYVVNRGFQPDWYNWAWSSDILMRSRVIIPFYNDDKIVGYTARSFNNSNPKYLTCTNPGYVFNLDKQTIDRKYVFVVEGQLDAIAIDGVAIMKNGISEAQIARLKLLGKEVIIVPDRDKAGLKLFDIAIDNNWAISFPDDWDPSIKDVADAVKKYGRIYTLYSLIKNKESNSTKNAVKRRKLESFYDRQGAKLSI